MGYGMLYLDPPNTGRWLWPWYGNNMLWPISIFSVAMWRTSGNGSPATCSVESPGFLEKYHVGKHTKSYWHWPFIWLIFLPLKMVIFSIVTWWLIPRIVSGFVHPSYKWALPPLIPLKSPGLVHPQKRFVGSSPPSSQIYIYIYTSISHYRLVIYIYICPIQISHSNFPYSYKL